MKLILILLILLAGCSTVVPVTQKFPTTPELLLEKCSELKQLTGSKISIVDYTKTVTENYILYHECSIKNTSWIDWYQKQKQVFEGN